MLAALSDGPCRIRSALAAGDTRATASCLRALGIAVSPLDEDRAVTVRGGGLRPFKRPQNALDCKNSGTTARLLMGLLAAHPFVSKLTGDTSLRRRPMGRIAEPLSLMQAKITTTSGHLPVVVTGSTLCGLDYTSPVASAQVKTALLFAGLAGEVPVTVREPLQSRDHTERLLKLLGIPVTVSGTSVTLNPVGRVPAFDGTVPGDFSSAAYLLALGVLGAARELEITGVNVNPTRTGLLRALERMGATVEVVGTAESLGEPVATLRPGRPAGLQAITVEPDEIPGMVDEVVLLACLASRAVGTSEFRGVGELRVKESDRLALVAKNLTILGVKARTEGDTLWVEGSDKPLAGKVVTAGDHRLAMSFAVLGALPGSHITLDDRSSVAVSYPAFFTDLKRVQKRA